MDDNFRLRKRWAAGIKDNFNITNGKESQFQARIKGASSLLDMGRDEASVPFGEIAR